jgi:hypothetical protein
MTPKKPKRESPQEIFEKVRDHMQWDDAKTKVWFETENPLFGGVSPGTLLFLRPEKALRTIQALIDGDGP